MVGQLDYERHTIYMYVDSIIENNVRLHSCEKEPGTVEWIEEWFKPGDVLYDIGANVGAYSLVTFRFLNGGTQVYAFEPGFVTFPQLCRNIHLNGAGQAIVPFQVALGDSTAITAFHYQNLLPGGALHALGESIDQYGNPFQPVFTSPTLSYRLDDFVSQFSLPPPNHVKLDVDGTEYQVLKGAEKALTNPQLRTVLLEVSEEHPHTMDVVSLLETKDFVLHSRRDGNSVFCRKGI